MVNRVRGLDGKTYPPSALCLADRSYLVGRAHYLAHDEGLSVRQIVARLELDHGVRRSVGSVSTWLRTWTCDLCSGGAKHTPEQAQGAS